MVYIECQKGNDAATAFVYRTECKEDAGEVTTALAALHNRRLALLRLAAHVEDLASMGPVRVDGEQPRERSEEEEQSKAADPTGRRTGAVPEGEARAALEQAAREAVAAVTNKNLSMSRPLSAETVEEHFGRVAAAVDAAFPDGLPESEPAREIVEGRENLEGHAAGKSVLDPATAVLWFAGKRMEAGRPLSDFVGTNDKCKIKAKLSKKGANAPQREPRVDEETKKKMMAMWHKKQQAAKELEEESEDSYLNSAWADSRAFRRNVHGQGEISWRGAGGF